jgi:hypothetical protein
MELHAGNGGFPDRAGFSPHEILPVDTCNARYENIMKNINKKKLVMDGVSQEPVSRHVISSFCHRHVRNR